MKKFVFLLLIAFTCLTLPLVHADQYVRSSRLYLFKTPSFDSDSQTFPLKGKQIVSIENKGLWVKIRVQGQEGWVNRLSLIDYYLKESAPTSISTPKPLKLRKEKKRVRVRVARATVGVKGLRESQATIQEEIGNFKALNQMVKMQSDKKSGIKFLLDYSE